MSPKRVVLTHPPKPPDSPEFYGWLDALKYRVENTIQSFMVYPSRLGTGSASLHGQHSAWLLNNTTETGYFEFVIPYTTNEIKEVGIRVIGTTTGTIAYTIDLSYGPVGGDENASTQTTGAVTGYSVTDDRIQEINITSLFTDQNRGDQVGVEFTLDGLTTTTEIYLLGLFFKYI